MILKKYNQSLNMNLVASVAPEDNMIQNQSGMYLVPGFQMGEVDSMLISFPENVYW